MWSERVLSLLGLSLLAGLAAAAAFITPGHSVLLPPCPFHELTGLFCPGCGSTRMLHYLMHGRFWLSFRQNPLAFVSLPFVVAGLINSAMPPGRRLRLPLTLPYFRSRAWPLTVLAVVIVYTVVRNISYWPGCLLAPGGICGG